MRYQNAQEVPTRAWNVQGTIYRSINEAKFAAAKLYALCDNAGVVVKAIKDGWTLLFWRR